MNFEKIKIWVLVPEMDTDDQNLAYYSDYEPSKIDFTKAFKLLNLPWVWQPVKIGNFRIIIDAIVDQKSKLTPIFLNLCDGDDANGIPGISVLNYLEEKNLIYTGSNPEFYEITTSKIVMKRLFDEAKVQTAAWEEIKLDGSNIPGIFQRLGKPLILKPSVSAGSLGIGIKSVVETEDELRIQVEALKKGYRGIDLTSGGLFVEQFIVGLEFTTFIIGSANDEDNALVYVPIERVFSKQLTDKEKLLSFDRIWGFYENEAPLDNDEFIVDYGEIPKEYEADVRRISWDAYKATKGDGYGRVDLRMDQVSKKIYVLEVNAQCELAEDDDLSSIGAILRYENQPFCNIVKALIENAINKKIKLVEPTKTVIHNKLIQASEKKKLKICVLQPDYSTSKVDYQNYDPPRNLSHLIPEAYFDHVFLNKLTTYKQLKLLSKKDYDIFVNLCDGFIEWEVPTSESFQFLELFNMPYTGSPSAFYDIPKAVMKYVAHTVGIATPNFAIIESLDEIEKTCQLLKFPLFVKPAKAGDSLGIDENSLVLNKEALIKKVSTIIDEYPEIMIEEYIEGREFTVLVAAGADNNIQTFEPVEFVFSERAQFKTYAMKTSDLHPKANVPVTNQDLNKKLRNAGKSIFEASNCNGGYGRLDFRMNAEGVLFFLEINFTCSVFYSDGFEGSADYILKHDGIGQSGFLKYIIEAGIERHKRQQKKYEVKGNSIDGYGIYAVKDLNKGEVILNVEGSSQRIITRNYVESNWNAEQQDSFKRYAYPLSSEVFVLWSEKPEDWAPHNHSCTPNTGYVGLDCVALRSIRKGEELTFDYAELYNEEMKSFKCTCGASNCRGEIRGTLNNSVTSREKVAQLTLKL